MSAPATILVVGASPTQRAASAALLAQVGYRIREAATPSDALALATSTLPKLVILDMAASAAVAACRALKASCSDVLILQTCAPDDEVLEGTDTLEGIDAVLPADFAPQQMLVLARSLLQLQRVKTDLRDSERRLELAQDSAGLAILDWNITSQSFVHSTMFATLFDLREGRAGALSPSDLIERIHPGDLGALIAEFSADSAAARSFDREFRIVRRDGAVRWIASRGRFFLGPDGTVDRMISLSSDVTARKEAERMNA